MEFEKFKRYIDVINNTFEKEEALARCIEQNLVSNSFCIVDICSDLIVSLVDLLATYYDCHYEIQEHLEKVCAMAYKMVGIIISLGFRNYRLIFVAIKK